LIYQMIYMEVGSSTLSTSVTECGTVLISETLGYALDSPHEY
jgi:hypothetical protein